MNNVSDLMVKHLVLEMMNREIDNRRSSINSFFKPAMNEAYAIEIQNLQLEISAYEEIIDLIEQHFRGWQAPYKVLLDQQLEAYT